jgi:uncharacterized protein (TIGR02453 family)
MALNHFNRDVFLFLKDLKANNNRDWFLANKHRYEASVKVPALQFIADFAPHLKQISRHLSADPKPHGGSLMRIYRDIRFSENKSPYKTNVGMSFPHSRADRVVHVPGFYLHLEPGECFAAAGIWHPDNRTLNIVRSAILNRTSEWKKVRASEMKLEGASLTRPPRGYPPDHPMIEDLKRKDFIHSVKFREKQICSETFLYEFTAACKKMSQLVAFLSKAVGLPY